MSRRAAVELSINFIVGMILGMVMFGLGLVFVYNLLAGVDKIREYGLPDTFKVYAENCVQRGDKVCIPEIKKEVPTRKTGSFGVVINNIAGIEKRFKPVVAFSIGILDDGNEATGIDLSKWTFTEFNEEILENNRHTTVEIPFLVPPGTKKGEYVFNVNVCFDSNDNIASSKCPGSYPSLYAPTQQVTIIVP